jgi:hypothetical protein
MRRQTEQFQCPTQESIPSFRYGDNATCRVRISAGTWPFWVPRLHASSAPQLGHYRFLPSPFQFIIHQSTYHRRYFSEMTTSSAEKRLLGLTTTRWCLNCQSYQQTRDKTTTTNHPLNLTEFRPSEHSMPYFLYMTFHNMVGGTWYSRPDFMLVSSHLFYLLLCRVVPHGFV